MWYGSVFKHPKRRHSWLHQPVVKGKESEAVRSCKLDIIPDHRTFRNRVTIGSSFKSSFSRAATSMEYTRKTVLTSAVCTEIYLKEKKKRPTMSIQCGSLWEPHNDQAEIMYLEDFHLGSPHDFTIRTNPNLQIVGNIKQIY